MGRIEYKSIEIPYQNEERALRIYLPKKYDISEEQSFSVLYMHDGQNLYFDGEATFGDSWKVKDTMEQLEEEGFTEGIIVVGIDNNPLTRLDEYSPWKNEIEHKDFKMGSHGGDGDKYAQFIVNTLKPFIDSEYRTLRNRDNTAVAGSSMGGIISTYLGIKYPNIFYKIGAFSTSSWFAEKSFLQSIQNSQLPKNQKFFIQVGTKESGDNEEMCQMYIESNLRFEKQLLDKGFNKEDILFVIGEGDIHNEKSWAKHFSSFIKFVF